MKNKTAKQEGKFGGDSYRHHSKYRRTNAGRQASTEAMLKLKTLIDSNCAEQYMQLMHF